LYQQNKLTKSKDALVTASHLNPPPAKAKALKINIEIVTRVLNKVSQGP
jgi:hypothetical protein